MAQARYSKVRLATLLGQSAEHGDRAEADDVLSTWFGEDTPAAFDRALCRAHALVNTAEGWAAIQDIAAQLLDTENIIVSGQHVYKQHQSAGQYHLLLFAHGEADFLG